MNLPPIARVRQVHNPARGLDVPGAVAEAIRSSRIADRVKPGGSIALTVGSRGIAGIDRIAQGGRSRPSSDGLPALRRRGDGLARRRDGRGATGLARRARRHRKAGRLPDPVRDGDPSSGPTASACRSTSTERPGADGIVLLNRIKPHTSFTGRYESGLLKMLTIGLGKHQGAEQVHKLGLPGLLKLLPEVGAFLLEKTPVALGIALLENAEEKTARVVGVEPEDLLDVEPRLLDEARTLMARLPFDQIDVLIVGELGKNYSGTGLDPNVIGRQRVETMPDLPRPVVTRLAVLDLSVETRGTPRGSAWRT